MHHAVAAPLRPYAAPVAPWRDGPFVRVQGGAAGCEVGQWGLIPPYSASRVPKLPNGRPLSTNNARIERVAVAPSFRDAWRRSQRCLIPAESYDEPYWGTGRNVWWRFARRDGLPWALAGIWSEWVDPASGEVVHSYAMLTQNCDGHPLLGLMHKPDPQLPADRQDKRCPAPLERTDWDCWLHGSPEQARALVRVPPAEIFDHGPADPGCGVRIG